MVNTLFNADKILGRSRNPWMDYAKGICIMMPVYRHTFEGIANVGVGSYSYPNIRIVDVFTMGFRMPLFFMIAGAFFAITLYKKGIGDFLNAKFKTVMYPLLLWGSIQITLQMIFAGAGVNANRTPYDYLNLILDPRKLEQFWYLNALFFVSLIYALLTWYLKFTSRQQLLVGLVFYGIATYCHKMNIDIGFLSGVTFYYLFFAVGDNLHNIVLDEKHHKWLSSWKTTLIILPVFAAVEWYCTTLNLAHPEEFDFYVQHQRQDIFFFSAIIGGLFMIHLAFMLQRFNVLRFLRVIGYHALYIYVAHLMVTASLRILFVNYLHIENIPLLQFTIWPLGVIIPIIMFNLSKKFGFSWLFTLKDEDGAKKKPKESQQYFTREAVVPKENLNK